MSVQGSEIKIIGVYGISGCGKTTLINQLKGTLGEDQFIYFDGSTAIDRVVQGGLPAFKVMSGDEQKVWREKAIMQLTEDCRESGKNGVVAGHAILWAQGEQLPNYIDTPADWESYTHLIYLDISADQVYKQRAGDAHRERDGASAAHLELWAAEEVAYLRGICLERGILVSVVRPGKTSVLQRVSGVLLDFTQSDEATNTASVERALDSIMQDVALDTVFVFDADRTLAPQDTGKMFWARVSGPSDPLKTIFNSSLRYTHPAFRQAALLYADVAASDVRFDKVCDGVAADIMLYPEILSFLHKLTKSKHAGAVVITSGLQAIWEKILIRAGLFESVKVIGAGTFHVVTPDVKANLVRRLQCMYGARVVAFGDSPLDLPMLCSANHAVVIVGEAAHRSQTMDVQLATAIDEEGLRAYQVLLPSTTTQRLDEAKLPHIELSHMEATLGGLVFLDASQDHPHASALLTSPTRDSSIHGPALREHHRQIGWFLSVPYLTEHIGLEEHAISHVQGRTIPGHRLLYENRTLVIPLMRGGEPMALGVNDAFPAASFLHAKAPADVQRKHIQAFKTVVP